MIILFKETTLYISLFIFMLISPPFIHADTSDHAKSFLINHEKQALQKEKIEHAFITKINNTFYFFPDDLNIVTLGDSLTQGVGDESKNSGYVGLIEDSLDNQIDIDNFGISGYRSDQLLELIGDPEVKASLTDADLVLMTIGANDMMKIFKRDLTHLQVEPFFEELANFEERLIEIFSTIHEMNPETDIYLIGFYNPFSEYFPEVEELADIASSWNAGSAMITNQFDFVHFIPTHTLFKGGVANYLADDQFHPNQKGYTEIANEVIEHIKTGVDDVYETK